MTNYSLTAFVVAELFAVFSLYHIDDIDNIVCRLHFYLIFCLSFVIERSK